MSVYQNNDLKEEETSRTLSLVVDNQPGTLARVIGLFSGRGYNIESLTVTEIDNRRHLSRISLVTRGTSMTIEQIKSQLLRIVPVHLVRDLTLEGPFIKSELALIKLVADGANRVEALRIAETFRARTLDVTLGSFVFELTGRPNKIDAFIGLMNSLGDIEISRTGVSAISRGNKTETKILEQIQLT
ncbi:acetolactate synthase small subunit [Pseudomonadota bacterium]|jgi:acetolactate synthase-1/3 small subunit|nr:acetolactate synthase small subunit [Alphaproteobacteria bacterium]MDC0456315.1 acetolactate synthase small subunit [Alphaproteobacteria bacterium]MDC1357715.1 acetolactate synthase small subunit [Pseudomonadota bacterium]